MIHLDTSFLIRALIPGSPQDAELREWLRADAPLAISAIGWAEFLCGPVEPAHVILADRVIPERIPFNALHGQSAAKLFNVSGRRRGSFADCMIAAVAIEEGATLATVNSSDFSRLAEHGLMLTQRSA